MMYKARMSSKIVFILLTCSFIVSCANQFTQATFTVETEEVVDFLSDQFTFDSINDIDSLPTLQGVSSSGYSRILLIGHPQLVKAILTIELGLEDLDSANTYQFNLLNLITPDATEAADWIHANYREAAYEGQIPEHNFDNAKLILKVDNGVNPYFMLTVIPINNTQSSP